MMGYTEDMFGFSITFVQWMMYCTPFLLYLIPITWIVLNWRFKPNSAAWQMPWPWLNQKSTKSAAAAGPGRKSSPW
jgi:hypothetical protein